MNNNRNFVRHDPPDAITDRRGRRDRRRNHLKAFLYQFTNPRRRHRHRRESDQHPFHVDIHEPALLAVVLITLSLCIVDVYATLTLLNKGGQELNPLMKMLIDTNVSLFFVIKYLLTAGGLFVLLSYRRFTFLGGGERSALAVWRAGGLRDAGDLSGRAACGCARIVDLLV